MSDLHFFLFPPLPFWSVVVAAGEVLLDANIPVYWYR